MYIYKYNYISCFIDVAHMCWEFDGSCGARGTASYTACQPWEGRFRRIEVIWVSQAPNGTDMIEDVDEQEMSM